MFINSHENQQNVKLNIDRTETVKHFEYSGMHIDNMLSMGKQVESILKNARCKIGNLFEIRKLISCETSLLIYKVMIRPHLGDGDFIIDLPTVAHVDELEHLPRKMFAIV